MGRGRSALRSGYVARLTRPVAPSDTSIWVDTDPVMTPPFYVTVHPLGTSEIIYVTVVNAGSGEWEFTGLQRNLPGSEDQTHLTNQFVLSAFNADSHDDIWDEIVALQQSGVVEITSAMSPYTVQTGDQILTCDVTGGAIMVNLPSVAANRGRAILIQQFGVGNTATASPTGGDGITSLDGNVVFQKVLNSASALWAAYAHPTAPSWMTTGENGTIT